MEVEKTKSDHLVVTIEQPNSTKAVLNHSVSLQAPLPMARTKTLGRLNFSKPRSRFEEVKQPATLPQKIEQLQHLNSNSDDDDDDDEWYEKEEEDEEEADEGEGNKQKRKMTKRSRRYRRKINKRAVMEWTLFLIIMTCLVCSLTLQSLKYDKKYWGLEIWKWCLMVMVVFSGRLVSGWAVGLIVFLIERNFMLREKVLYFVYGLRKSFQNCAWLALVLIAWMIMFPNVHRHSKVLKKVFRALVAILIGATIWLLKILFVKVLASSFHVATFFDRMQESVFHHYILESLSGVPLEEEERDKPRGRATATRPHHQLGLASSASGPRRIDKEKLKRLSMESRATAWSVKRLVNLVMSSRLSTISTTVDAFGNAESEITSELEARTTARRIFKNVAKHGAQ